MLRSVGSQRVEHNLTSEQQLTLLPPPWAEGRVGKKPKDSVTSRPLQQFTPQVSAQHLQQPPVLRGQRVMQQGLLKKPQDGGPSKKAASLQAILWLFPILLARRQHSLCHTPPSSSHGHHNGWLHFILSSPLKPDIRGPLPPLRSTRIASRKTPELPTPIC